MRALATILCLITAVPVWADARLTVLMDVMRIDEAVSILRAEGLSYADDLDTDMLGGGGGQAWSAQVAAIYDPDAMTEAVRAGLGRALQGETLEQAIAFFATRTGGEIARLENAAREAITDKAVEEAAIARYHKLRAAPDARFALVEKFVKVNDLTSRNVTGSMNDDVQFMTGLVDGGAFEMTEAEILADAASDPEALWQETEEWMFGYLLLAYSPLPDADLDAYVRFCETPAGQALNRGLFDGFGAAYEDISYALGRAVALNLTASEL